MIDSSRALGVFSVEKLSPEEEQKYKAYAREKAYEYIKRLSDSRAEVFAMDYEEDIIDRYVEGFLIGFAEGRAEMIKVVFDNLRDVGMSEEQIRIALDQRNE